MSDTSSHLKSTAEAHMQIDEWSARIHQFLRMTLRIARATYRDGGVLYMSVLIVVPGVIISSAVQIQAEDVVSLGSVIEFVDN